MYLGMGMSVSNGIFSFSAIVLLTYQENGKFYDSSDILCMVSMLFFGLTLLSLVVTIIITSHKKYLWKTKHVPQIKNRLHIPVSNPVQS